MATLMDLTKNNRFTVRKVVEANFQNTKNIMTSVVVFSLPDLSQPFLVECDAFDIGTGVAMQIQWVICFQRNKFTIKKLLSSSYDKEFQDIMHDLEKFKEYLLCFHCHCMWFDLICVEVFHDFYEIF